MKVAALCVSVTLGLTWAWADPPPRPVPAPPDAEKVRELVKRLNDKRFAVREQADRALRQFGIRVVPLLRQELTRPPCLEAERRLEKIVRDLTQLGWHRDLAAAKSEAARQNKPLLVFSTIGEPGGFA
jgi:hypothetical protein